MSAAPHLLALTNDGCRDKYRTCPNFDSNGSGEG
jgi:hypothetical protein